MVKKLLTAALFTVSLFGTEAVTDGVEENNVSTQQEQEQAEEKKPLSREELLDEKVISFIG